jgi:hypothetical protein
MAGSKMLTAEVLAFTTSVEMQVAASTPPARLLIWATSSIRHPPVTDPRAWAVTTPTVGACTAAGPHP